MGRWAKEELEEAFDKYQKAALKGAQSKDWSDWANCFTTDATYYEHHYGHFWGRERILNWITETMNQWPASEMTASSVTVLFTRNPISPFCTTRATACSVTRRTPTTPPIWALPSVPG